jgi:hypothetical protein
VDLDVTLGTGHFHILDFQKQRTKYFEKNSTDLIADFSSADQWACAGGSPTPQTGFVTAIFSKLETIASARGMAFFTDGDDREASWLTMLSHTSVTQMACSSAESLATT